MKNEIQNAYINALLADAVYISKNSPINAIGEGILHPTNHKITTHPY